MKLDLPPEVIAVQLEEHRQHFERGDKSALIAAIRFCFNEEVVAPEWVVDAFFRATNKWYSMEAKELGEAFGLEWPKGKSVAAAKKKRRLKWAVHNAIWDAKLRRAPCDDELFAKIGKRLGIGVTLVKEYYASARAQFNRPPAAAAMLLEEVETETQQKIATPGKREKLRRYI